MYDYSDKLITTDEAVALVKDHDNFYSGWGFDHPRDFLSNLHKAAIERNVKDVRFVTSVCPYFCEFMKPEYRENFRIDSLYQGVPLRKALKGGANLTYSPTAMSTCWKRSHREHVNIYVTATSMPDKHGYVSLSFDCMYAPEMIKRADIVIFEMNPNFPRTFGDSQVHLSQATYVTEANYPAPELPDGQATEIDEKIGEIVAAEVNDGDCIQVGIGTLPNMICHKLVNKKHLGIHSELMTTGLYELIKCGAVDNSRKNLYPGKSVACFICGSQEMYDYIDDNPEFRIKLGVWTNDVRVASQIDNYVAINCALQVDFAGQCASENINNEQISGIGGQNELTEAAQWSKGGRAYICLHSTSTVKDPVTGEKKVVSNIVPYLEAHSMVTTLRSNVDNIVTEYGIARFRGATNKERAKQLIAIAHPDFREELTKKAVELGYLNDLDF